MPPPTFEQLVHNNLSLGMNPDSAFVMAAKQDPEAYQRYLMAARDTKQAAVQKDVPLPKPPPPHWSLVKLLEMKAQLVQKSATPLTDAEAWHRTLATDAGQALWDAFYAAHPHLRRQG